MPGERQPTLNFRVKQCWPYRQLHFALLHFATDFREHQQLLAVSVKDGNRRAGVQAKKISSLKPNVSCEQAIRRFTSGALNLAANLTRGRGRSAAEPYLPYRSSG
jgi:hypothetical protein